jgi:YfiH family protein
MPKTISGTTTKNDGNWHVDGLTERRVADFIEKRHGVRANRVVWSKQVHGKQVLSADEQESGSLGDGDALISTEPGVALTVRTADCVPVFIEATGAVGMVHAGFAGTSHEVLPAAIHELAKRHGIKPEQQRITFGPHICEACYFVRSEANQQAAGRPAMRSYLTERDGRQHVNLHRALIDQARATGAAVDESAVLCSKHDPGHWSSRAEDGERMLSYIMLSDA